MKNFYLNTILFMSVFFSTSLFSQLPNFVPATDLVGYWPFNGNANDLSINLNHGTVTGASLTTGHNGDANNAYDFATGIDRIFVSTIDQSVFSGDYTISIWVYFNSFTLDDSHLLDGQNNFVSLSGHGPAYTPNNQKIGFYTMDDQSNTQPLGALTNYNTLPLNMWSHLVINRMGTTLSITINNVQDVIITNYPGNTLMPGTGLHFGNYFLDGYNLDGKLDNIGIWTRSLSTQEVSNLYNELNVGIQPTISDERLKICPNPSNGNFTVQTPYSGSFTLLSATGSAIKTYLFNKGINNLNENLSPGIYFLRNNESGWTDKLVIE